MNRSLRTLTLILLVNTAVSACASGNNPPVENAVPQTPDASVKLSGGVLGVGVAYKWGRGTLNYQGMEYDFCIRGLALGDVGVASLEAQGDVFSLRSVTDFSGKYFAISSGFAVGRGGSFVLTKNNRGVMMRLAVHARGVRFNIAANGLRIILANQSGCEGK